MSRLSKPSQTPVRPSPRAKNREVANGRKRKPAVPHAPCLGWRAVVQCSRPVNEKCRGASAWAALSSHRFPAGGPRRRGGRTPILTRSTWC